MRFLLYFYFFIFIFTSCKSDSCVKITPENQYVLFEQLKKGEFTHLDSLQQTELAVYLTQYHYMARPAESYFEKMLQMEIYNLGFDYVETTCEAIHLMDSVRESLNLSKFDYINKFSPFLKSEAEKEKENVRVSWIR